MSGRPDALVRGAMGEQPDASEGAASPDGDTPPDVGESTARPAPPPWFRVLWRGALFLWLAVFFAFAGVLARALIGGFGGVPGPLLAAAFAALLAGVILLPLAVVVDIPDALYAHWLPARRASHGRCPACGYDTAHAPARKCPECHARLVAPKPYSASWGTLRRAGALALPAWMAGCAIGFAYVLQDERAFTVETETRCARDASVEVHSRPRAGVAKFAALRWTRAEGYSGVTPLANTRERGWRPRAPR